MAFYTALMGYEKTGVSELQRVWQILGNIVAEQAGIQGGERTLLQIDEVMSWESVKNLRYALVLTAVTCRIGADCNQLVSIEPLAADLSMLR